MKKAATMIDLGRKPSQEKLAPSEKNPVYYPSISLSPDSPIEFPKGPFTARVKLKLKRAENSEDERGNKRHSYTLDVHGFHPEFEAEEASEKVEKAAAKADGDDDGDDAATSIMKAMGKARQKKMASKEDDSD